jgi:NhaA family Na+:H+ antiporter
VTGTLALFVAGLAFTDAQLLDQAKIGILLGSLASGVAGFLIFRLIAEVPAGSRATLPSSVPTASLDSSTSETALGG